MGYRSYFIPLCNIFMCDFRTVLNVHEESVRKVFVLFFLSVDSYALIYLLNDMRWIPSFKLFFLFLLLFAF